MIDALITGKLASPVTARTGKNGSRFVTFRARIPTEGGEAIFANVICFNAPACDALLALEDGDAVALAGALTPRAWADREGQARPALDLLAHNVLTPYHVTRKRKAMQTAEPSHAPAGHSIEAEPLDDGRPLDF